VRGLKKDERNQSGQAEIDGDKSSSLTTHRLSAQKRTSNTEHPTSNAELSFANPLR
jgi:hypothetical protein